MSVNTTLAMDPAANLIRDTVRQEHNKLVVDFAYFAMNRPNWQFAATPGVARATTASAVKTTTTTQLYVNGQSRSLTATDNLWALTADAANILALGSVRRYLLLWDGATATTVTSVQASNDVVIATAPAGNGFAAGTAGAALFAARFYKTPAITTTIVGILSIVNVTNPFIPGTTLLSATGVTDTYVDGPDANAFSSSQVNP